MVRLIEEDKKDWDNEAIEDYIVKLLSLNIISKKEINKIFNFYKQNNFSLLRLIKDGKIPVEKNWTNKEHRDIVEWKKWIDDGGNIGVRTGEISGITVIDIDSKEIPPIFLSIETLSQETNHGFHFFFKYDDELPKTRIDSLKIDLENNGGQVVISPSSIGGFIRRINFKPIMKIPAELKEWLIKNLHDRPKKELNELPTKLNIANIEEGNRNNLLLQLGGTFRKNLSLKDTKTALSIVNTKLCKPPLPNRELFTIVRSLNKYIEIDKREVTKKILDYIRLVGEASSRDIQQELDLEKKEIDEILNYLVKEEYVIKNKGYYKTLKKVTWKEEFSNESKLIDYKMPYFYDVALFRDSDLLILGGITKSGKSHQALNIIADLVQQGKKPYYVNLEAGNRFASIALQLGLKEGDFYYATEFNPEEIELEDNAITIIDWLLPKDYSATDKIIQHFSSQLVKHKGNLIVFVQLRSNGDFFAKDMIGFFPAFVSRYFYDDETGQTGYWQIDYMRESKYKRSKQMRIPCRYLWEEKRLIRIDEMEKRYEKK